MTIDFTGKRVLVTGGTRGIGRAMVELFLEAGARVALNGSSEETTARAVAELGDRVVAAPGSVAIPDQCRRVVEAAVAGLGGLDVLVNNAGVADLVPLPQVEEAAFDRIFGVNVKGLLFCTKHAAPELKRSRGAIVNVASISGIVGAAGDSVYAASKAAVIAMTRCHAMELAPEVRVNALCPGSAATDMLRAVARAWHGDERKGIEAFSKDPPLRRIADPKEMARPALYLASDLASFVTGSIHVVDGGETVD